MPAPPFDLHHYLCSHCNHFFAARANSVDRTREVRCPACLAATPTYPQWHLAPAPPARGVLRELTAEMGYVSDPPATVAS